MNAFTEVLKNGLGINLLIRLLWKFAKCRLLYQHAQVKNGHVDPSYLSDLLSLYIPPRHLRTSGCELLCEPRFRLSSMGGRSFSVIAPKLWNSLPLALRTTTTLHEFKSKLKTHLFKKYYLSWHVFLNQFPHAPLVCCTRPLLQLPIFHAVCK